MSIFSDEEENELINFENLKILDLFEDHSDIEAAECFDINSDKKKIISIKMDNSEKTNDDKSKKTSAKSKSKKSEVREEEIHELKYNLYLGLFRDCLPAINDYKKIINKRNLKGQSLIIQLVEILEDQQVFHQKNYFFMPPGPEKELFFEIEENKFLKVSKGENVNMELCMKVDKDFKKIKDLKKFDEKTGPDIINKITIKKNDKSSKNKESPPESGTTQNSQNISLNKNQPSNINIINLDNKSDLEIGTNPNQDNSKNSQKTGESELSKLDRSSENELERGILFFEEIEKGTKYKKYSFSDSFKKEIDGIYCYHSGINLGIEKKELNFDEYKTYEDFVNKYMKNDKNNDLHGYILMKNFDKKTIPKNTPFIIEIKAGFDLVTLLKQIKKSAKYVKNLQNFDSQLPEYFIGILCSFNEFNVMKQLGELNKSYNGSNSADKASNFNLLMHINKIIDNLDIKFVIAVIKDEKINGYDLGIEDYHINYDGKNYKKVDLLYMYKAINNNYNLEHEELKRINEKIETVTKNFLKAYETFDDQLTVEIPYIQNIAQEKKIQELEEKIKTLERIKNNEDNLPKEKNKIEEQRKKIYEEEKKKMEEEEEKNNVEVMKKIEEERKKIEEKRKKMYKEVMKKIEEERREIEEQRMKILEEERKKMHEEEMNKMPKEEDKKKLKEAMKKIEEEKRKKMQDEKMNIMHEEEENKKIEEEEEKKKIEEKENKKLQGEEEKKAKEDRSKNEQEPEHCDKKK